MLSLVKNRLIFLLLMAEISALKAGENFALNKNSSTEDYYKQGGAIEDRVSEFAQEMLDKSKLDLEQTFANVKDLEMLLNKIPIGEGGSCKDCSSEIQNTQNKEADIANGILVFVSFSMPKASLIELSDQSHKYDATLVLRGIYNQSFMKTQNNILSISPNGLSLTIHPELFKQYDIKRVPTFVLVKNGKEVNRLSGNVTLEFASQKLQEEQ